MIGIIGRPLSGKSTLCRLIEDNTDFFVFRPGRLVRACGDKEIYDDRSAHWNFTIISIVQRLPFLSVIDGFPRGFDQLQYVNRIIHMEVSVATFTKRLKIRARDDDDKIWTRMKDFDKFFLMLKEKIKEECNIDMFTVRSLKEGLDVAKDYWKGY